MDSNIVFLAVAFAILIGFIANYLFRRFKAPDVLILIGLGFLFGPSALGVIDSGMTTYIDDLTPYVAALALAIIMFDAGLDLNFREVVLAFPKASLYTIAAFLLSVLVTANLCVFTLGWDVTTALLLGAILGGTSGAVVIALVNHLDISKDTRTVLTLEAALTDVLVIVVAMALIVILSTGNSNPATAFVTMLLSFVLSSIIGFLAGLVWLRVLSLLTRQPFSYMITLAALLLVFSSTEILLQGSGGGSIAALVFGLVLGNHAYLERKLNIRRGRFSFDEEIKGFHTQITFFIRTFFFVYLGIVISSMSLQTLHLLLGVVITVTLLAARWLVAHSFGSRWRRSRADRLALGLMLPRGLAAAVVASLPVGLGAVTSEVGAVILGTTTIVILLTTVIASLGALYIDKVSRQEKRPFFPSAKFGVKKK